jgi:NADH:ubiquinone oxidoreductase subunit E/NAD-dependent dihydropyrimidine dehydrogenase PreA subunit
MSDVKVVIDGAEVSGQGGLTILEAAKQAGVEIPTLCHIPGLTPSGACRLCVVEVDGAGRLVGACHTPIVPGMTIHTRSARVLEARRAIVELLFAGHTGPCVKDAVVEQCQLHRIAGELEVGPPRFPVRKPRFFPVENISPYVRRDLSKCILCYRCIRACAEIAEKNVYSMAYRGFSSKVVVDEDVPLNKEVCRDCGICIDYCPTSALTSPSGKKQRKEPDFEKDKRQGATFPKDKGRERLLGMLIDVQRREGHVSEEAMSNMALSLNIPLSEVYGVATFYAFVSVRPQGRNVIRICKSLPCTMQNAPMIVESVKKEIGIEPGETTLDGRFSVGLTNCIGACDQAPAMLVNEDVHGWLTPEKISFILRSYK